MRTLPLAAVAWLSLSSSAFGQIAPPNPPPAFNIPTRTWRVGLGYEVLEIRDVSRTGRPVDASPVTWRGRGPALAVTFDRSNLVRLHRLQLDASWAGGFALVTPLRTIPQHDGEKAALLAGRYEYRRYPFRDLGAAGLDAGVGVETAAAFSTLTRVFDPEIVLRDRGTDLTAAVVAAARLRRWRTVQLEVAWANGVAVGRRSTRHTTAVEPDAQAWGGGWLTDLTIRADVRVSDAVAVFTSYFNTGRGRYQSHGAATTARDHFIIGVSYAR
jgi:hypothetical protein